MIALRVHRDLFVFWLLLVPNNAYEVICGKQYLIYFGEVHNSFLSKHIVDLWKKHDQFALQQRQVDVEILNALQVLQTQLTSMIVAVHLVPLVYKSASLFVF